MPWERAKGQGRKAPELAQRMGRGPTASCERACFAARRFPFLRTVFYLSDFSISQCRLEDQVS
jgi:hypothetical protein